MPSPVYMAIPWRWTIWRCSASVGFADVPQEVWRSRDEREEDEVDYWSEVIGVRFLSAPVLAAGLRAR
jgi:hypothetical protein